MILKNAVDNWYAGWRVSDEAFARPESHQVKFLWAHLEDIVDQATPIQARNEPRVSLILLAKMTY